MNEIVIVLVFLIIAYTTFYIFGVYDQVRVLQKQYLDHFSKLEVQLKRRHDLINQIAEISQSKIPHKNQTLINLTEARINAVSALSTTNSFNEDKSLTNLSRAEIALQMAFERFKLELIDYPELQGNKMISRSINDLSSIDSIVSFSRQAYNNAARAYNEFYQLLPQNILALLGVHHNDVKMLYFFDSEEIQQTVRLEI